MGTQSAPSGMVQVYLDYVIDRISSKSKAWAGFTIVWLLILFIASCIQANVSTAETEGNTEIMPDFECGKWLSSEASQEWGLASAGEYNNPYGIEYSGSTGDVLLGLPVDVRLRLCGLHTSQD